MAHSSAFSSPLRPNQMCPHFNYSFGVSVFCSEVHTKHETEGEIQRAKTTEDSECGQGNPVP